MKTKSLIAQDVEKARKMGLSYGQFKALELTGFWPRKVEITLPGESRRCPNCGKPVAGRCRIYCDAQCSQQYRDRIYRQRRKMNAGGMSNEK